MSHPFRHITYSKVCLANQTITLAAYTIKFFLCVPQADLTADGDEPLVNYKLIEQNAYARALVERGEDGGLSSSEAYNLYRSMLSDYIALEATRLPEMQEFVAV